MQSSLLFAIAILLVPFGLLARMPPDPASPGGNAPEVKAPDDTRAVAVAAQGEPNKPTATLRLVRTRELRQQFEPGESLESPHAVFDNGGPPGGDWLMFDLAFAGIPEKSRVVHVKVVSESAKDDVGTDLVAGVMERLRGDLRKRAEQAILMSDAAPAIRWFVAAPPRKAATVDAALVVRAEISAKRDPLEIRPTREWQALDHPSVNGMKAEYRWSTPAGMGPYLEVRPRGVEKYINFISARPPHFRGRAHYSSGDSYGVSFLLAKGTAEGEAISIDLHADLKTVDATLKLNAHPLPD